ncbi:hypothetical protein BDF19DRAFT_452217 [Syncephalis fuscata]|nr:hypothetical protein BDF19DRAFT_452217 [Syncephalis fuscata]
METVQETSDVSSDQRDSLLREIQHIACNLTPCINEISTEIETYWTKLIQAADRFFQCSLVDDKDTASAIVDIIYLCAAYQDDTKPWANLFTKEKSHLLLNSISQVMTTQSTESTITPLHQLIRCYAIRLVNARLQQYFTTSKPLNNWDDLDGPAWKSTAPECIPVIDWLLVNLSNTDTTASGNQRELDDILRRILPLILTIMNDSDLHTIKHGLDMLVRIMHSTSPSMILRTGLVEVLYETIQQKLLYRGHEPDELALMMAAIGAMLIWSQMYQSCNDNPSGISVAIISGRLEMAMRNGPLLAIRFHGERKDVAASVFSTATPLIQQLDLLSVKFLEALIPFTCDWIKAPPVGVSRSALDIQLMAVKFACTLIDTCEPRIVYYHGQLLVAMATAWQQLEKSSQGASDTLADKTPLRTNLQAAVKLLYTACKADSQATADRTAIAALDDNPTTNAQFRTLLSDTSV